MKTRIFITIAAAFLLVSNIYAAEPATKVYTNEETTKYGCVKEFITVENETLRPLSKTVYKYDTNNHMQAKVLYKWNDTKGWESVQKYDYEYNLSGQIATLIYTKWDERLNTWSAQSEQLIHVYDAEGKFLAVRLIQVNNALTNLMAEK